MASLYACITGCSTDKKDWHTAKLNNDVISYEYYVEKYPTGDCRDSANMLIQELRILPPQIPPGMAPPIPKWNNKIIDRLALHVSVSFNFLSEEFRQKQELAYYNTIEEVLENIGISVISPDTQGRTKLDVQLNVKAFKQNYLQWGNLYSGYELKGMISLTSDNEDPITLTIDTTKPCPERASYKAEMIESLKHPAYVLYELKIKRYFFDFLYDTWGPSPCLWIDTYSLLNYDLPTEFRVDYEGDLSQNLIINAIRACCCDVQDIRNRALDFINSNKSRGKIDPKMIQEIGPYLVTAIPILIKKAEDIRKMGASDNGLITTLELLTGKKFDVDAKPWKKEMKHWKKWWFNNKQTLLDR